jgi:hypothetical protein
MKTGAVVMIASFAMMMTACVLDKNVEGEASAGIESQQQQNGQASRQMIAALEDVTDAQDTHKPDGSAALRDAPRNDDTTGPARRAAPSPGNGTENDVRDAKEATEEAARKIYDAAVGAATKIKEVSRGAVQSVREGTREKNQQEPPAQIDSKDFETKQPLRGAGHDGEQDIQAHCDDEVIGGYQEGARPGPDSRTGDE